MLAKVRRDTCGGFLHPFISLVPVGRANLTILFKENKSVQHAESFLNAAAKGKIVHDLVAHYAFLIDQEKPAVCLGSPVEREITFFR